MNDCIAIVVSATGSSGSSRDQAELARQLVEAKVEAGQEVVRLPRYKQLQEMRESGIRVLFHQGGSPSRWRGVVQRVGCLIAAGRLGDVKVFVAGSRTSDVEPELWRITLRVFGADELTHLVNYSDVKRIPHPPLTKETLQRPPKKPYPMPGENFIVVQPGESSYSKLLRLWGTAFCDLRPRG